LLQFFSFASLANAFEDFDLIGSAPPACKNCAEKNNAPSFDQTRVAMQDAYGQAPDMIGSDPVVEAPPSIGATAPVTIDPMPEEVGVKQFADQSLNNQQTFIDQQGFVDQPRYEQLGFEQPGYAELQQFSEPQYLESGGLGESALGYPSDLQSGGYLTANEIPMNYDQTGFEQMLYDQNSFSEYGYEQGFDSGAAQVNYDSPYPTQDFGQEIGGLPVEGMVIDETPVEGMPVEQYPMDQTYISYQEMPGATQQQNFAQTYTSSASSSSGNVQPGLAQQKAVQAAQSGVRGHLSGGLGGAKYEGVGWSNHSAQNAINSCCYWGVRPTAQIGVSKGNDGFWYACVLYY